MNIPIGNTTPVLTKNFHYVLDGVYFIRNDSTFEYGKGYSYYISNGVNKNNVMNIILNLILILKLKVRFHLVKNLDQVLRETK
jgi:hypothetical protein